MEIVLLYNKSNQFGLRQDATVFAEVLREVAPGTVRIREADPLEVPVPCEVAIHLENPIYSWMPWSLTNYLLLNPEWYMEEEWKPYLQRMDGVLFRDEKSRERFVAAYPTIPTWCLPWTIADDAVLSLKKTPQSKSPSDGCVWFLGGSKNKRTAAEIVLPLWKESYPPLHVYATKALDLSGSIASNVIVKVQELDPDARKKLAAYYPGHVCLSEAEAFGYAAAEAEANGAFLILNNLDVYSQDYSSNKNVAWVSTDKQAKGLASVAGFSSAAADTLSANLERAVDAFLAADMAACRKEQILSAFHRKERLVTTEFPRFWKDVKAKVSEKKPAKPKHLPPVLHQEDCPPISIITLLYNRRKFFDLACHSILLSDYPKDKIEWVIVEDSDDPNEDASDRVVQVGLKAAPLTLVYVPLEKKTPIGEKRNLGIQRAKNDIILMMDDDDHYPETSVRRRVAWLTKHPWKPQAVSCTTIACYDLLRGVSAVNMPPLTLPLRKRVSEATLTFYKSWWEQQKFPSYVSSSEGDEFLQGREQDVLEIPPQQIIVAFSHKNNTSGRRIPADDAKPGCFWGFPKEFLIYIHKLAGVEVEEDKEDPRRR